MRILHVSDTHGTFPELPDSERWDILVHSGDFLPTAGRVQGRILPVREFEYQSEWLLQNAQRIADWKMGRPAYGCPGNHDFVPDWPHFAMISQSTVTMVDGVSLHAYPWIPRDDGEWAYEVNETVHRNFVRGIPECDVLVAHAPPFDCLDSEDGNWGIRSMVLLDPVPRLYLCGHVHAQGGKMETWRGCRVVNSATTWQIVSYPEV